MLRWLSSRAAPQYSQQENLVTDDPLATLDLNQQLFSVSRQNPLFREERANSTDYDAGYQSQQSSEHETSERNAHQHHLPPPAHTRRRPLAEDISGHRLELERKRGNYIAMEDAHKQHHVKSQQGTPIYHSPATPRDTSETQISPEPYCNVPRRSGLSTGNPAILNTMDSPNGVDNSRIRVQCHSIEGTAMSNRVAKIGYCAPTSRPIDIRPEQRRPNLMPLKNNHLKIADVPAKTDYRQRLPKNNHYVLPNKQIACSTSINRKDESRDVAVSTRVGDETAIGSYVDDDQCHYDEPIIHPSNGSTTRYGPDSLVTDSLLILTAPADGKILHDSFADNYACCRPSFHSSNATSEFVTDSLVRDTPLVLTRLQLDRKVDAMHKTVNSTPAEKSRDIEERLPNRLSHTQFPALTDSDHNYDLPNTDILRGGRKFYRASDRSSITSSETSTTTNASNRGTSANNTTDYVVQLWASTGMRTNGRKLLTNDSHQPVTYHNQCKVSEGVNSTTPLRTVSRTVSSESASSGSRIDMSVRLPLSGGWLKRVSVSSDEFIVPTLQASAEHRLQRLIEQCHREHTSPESPRQRLKRRHNCQNMTTASSSCSFTDTSSCHDADAVKRRRGKQCIIECDGGESSDINSEKRVTFAANTIDNENDSAHLQHAYSAQSLLHTSLPAPEILQSISSPSSCSMTNSSDVVPAQFRSCPKSTSNTVATTAMRCSREMQLNPRHLNAGRGISNRGGVTQLHHSQRYIYGSLDDANEADRCQNDENADWLNSNDNGDDEKVMMHQLMNQSLAGFISVRCVRFVALLLVCAAVFAAVLAAFHMLLDSQSQPVARS